MPTRKGVYDRAKSAGLSDEEAIALADSFDSNSLKNTGSRGTPFVNMQRLDDAINEAVLNAARRKAGTSGQPAAATPSAGAVGATYISNITIPGVGSASPQFANAASQSQTEDLFRSLAQLKGASA